LRIKVFGSKKIEIDGDLVFVHGKGHCAGRGHPFYHYQTGKEQPDIFTIKSGEDKKQMEQQRITEIEEQINKAEELAKQAQEQVEETKKTISEKWLAEQEKENASSAIKNWKN